MRWSPSPRWRTSRGTSSRHSTPSLRHTSSLRRTPSLRHTLWPFSLWTLSLALAPVSSRAEPPPEPPRDDPPAIAEGRADESHSDSTPVSVEINAGLRCMRAGSACEGQRSVHKVPALFGLRGSQTQVHGEDGKAGIGLVSQSAAYMTDRRAQITARTAHFAFLGGGRAGLEGGIGLSVGMGLYQPVAKSHGPFSRLGGRGFLLGNAALYASLLELPTLELGYQLLERDLHLELSGHGGAVLTGRYKPGDERRKLGSAFGYGGLLAARFAAVDLELDLSRVEPGESDANGPFDMLTLLLCGGARYFGVCFDARIMDGGVPVRGGSRDIQSSFLGLSVGGLTQEPPRGHH